VAAPTVLIVEHDDVVRTGLAAALRAAGYAVLSAADGAAALALLTHAPHAQPEAVLLDLVLPTMSGQQFVYAYHQLPGPHAPVLALTPGPAPTGAPPQDSPSDEVAGAARPLHPGAIAHVLHALHAQAVARHRPVPPDHAVPRAQRV
jgi:CheY-like chemotaxis protein